MQNIEIWKKIFQKYFEVIYFHSNQEYLVTTVFFCAKIFAEFFFDLPKSIVGSIEFHRFLHI